MKEATIELRDSGTRLLQQVYRVSRLAAYHHQDNEAFTKVAEQLCQTVKDLDNVEERSARILFFHQSILIGTQYLKASRAVYEMATELRSVLETMGANEIVFDRSINVDDVAELAALLSSSEQKPSSRGDVTVGSSIRFRKVDLDTLSRQTNRTRRERLVYQYTSAIVVVRRLYENLKDGKYLMIPQLKRVSQALIDLREDENLLALGIGTMRNVSHDDAGRAVNAAALAVAAVAQVSDDRELLSLTAMTTLLADSGRPRAAGMGIETQRIRAIPRLTREGHQRMAASTAVVLTAMGRLHEKSLPRIVISYEALSHQYVPTKNTVYGNNVAVGELAIVIATVWRFVNLLRFDVRSQTQRTAVLALGIMMRDAQNPRDERIVTLLASALGILPAGTAVELSSGWLGIVSEASRVSRCPTSPAVRLVLDDRTRAIKPFDVDLGTADHAEQYGEVIGIVEGSAHPAMDRMRWEIIDGLEKGAEKRSVQTDLLEDSIDIEIVAPDAETRQDDLASTLDERAAPEEEDEADTNEFSGVKKQDARSRPGSPDHEEDEPATNEYPHVKQSQTPPTLDDTEELLRAYLADMAATEAKYAQKDARRQEVAGQAGLGEAKAGTTPERAPPAPGQRAADPPPADKSSTTQKTPPRDDGEEDTAVGVLGRVRSRVDTYGEGPTRGNQITGIFAALDEDTRAMERGEADKLLAKYKDSDDAPPRDATPIPPAFPVDPQQPASDTDSTRTVDRSEADELLKAFADFSGQPSGESDGDASADDERASDDAQVVTERKEPKSPSIPILEIPKGFLEKSSVEAGPAATPASGFERHRFAKPSNTDVTKKHRVPHQAELASKAADPSFMDDEHTPNLSKSEADNLLKGFSAKETTKKRPTPPPPGVQTVAGRGMVSVSPTGDLDQTPPSGVRPHGIDPVAKHQTTQPSPGEQSLYKKQANASAPEDLDQTPPRGFHVDSTEAVTKRQHTPRPPGIASLDGKAPDTGASDSAAFASTPGQEPVSVSSSGPLLPDIDLVLPDELQPTTDDAPPEPPQESVGEALVVPDTHTPDEEDVEEAWILEDYESTKAMDEKKARELLKSFVPEKKEE